MSEQPGLRLGTRGSPLALWQTRQVEARLNQLFPALQTEICILNTRGDQILDRPLAAIGDKGLFTQELEEGLLQGSLDLAVHSLKDLPTELPPGLALGAILERHAPWDVLVSRDQRALAELPPGALIGTGSQRRQRQLQQARPDLRFADLRGNIQTRLNKLARGDYDAIVMAQAALDRLELTQVVREMLPPEIMLPAVGQGAIGVEIAAARPDLAPFLTALNDPLSAACCLAERAFLRAMGGGCQTPLGAWARLNPTQADELWLSGYLALESGEGWRAQVSGTIKAPEALGQALAQRLPRQQHNPA
jgi:hydroxymethylbilane synthase